MAPYYAHFEDLIEAFVGPFDTPQQCDEHARFCEKRGDGGTYHGAVTKLPEDAFILSPEEDTNFGEL